MRSCHCLWEAKSRLQHAFYVCKQSLCKDFASGAATSCDLCSFALSLSSVPPRLQGQVKALPFWQCATAALPTWYIGGFANMSQVFFAIISDSGVNIVSVSHCTHSRLKHAVTSLLLICSCIMILQLHYKECKTCHLGFKFAPQSSSNASNSTSTRAQPAKRLIGDCSVSSDMVHEIIP